MCSSACLRRFGGINQRWEPQWITPTTKFFSIAHSQGPLGPAIDERDWWLEITGRVQRPLTFALRDLKARPRQEVICYEMNSEPLPQPNGFPLRLIAPGWYGIANVKWLKRIEVRDSWFMGRWMAREYVTLREEERHGETV